MAFGTLLFILAKLFDNDQGGETKQLMANVPEDLHYSKDHEWVRVDGNIATIGITDYAQNSLGDVVYVELSKPGDELAANESFGSVESVKAVSELFTPVSGQVTEDNEACRISPRK